MDGFDQLHGFHVQGVRQLYNREQAYVTLSTFQVSHVVAVKVGHFSEFFLRQTALFTQFSQAASKSD